MELDSENITPPSSPTLGYSGCKDEQSIIDSGVTYCLNCKGIPKKNDHSFSPEGYILRRELISALENIKTDAASFVLEDRELRLIKCFNNHQFDPLDKDQLKMMVTICRKRVSSLEILSESSNSYNNYDLSTSSIAADDPDELCNQNPWLLRKSVCQFLSFVVRQLKFYRVVWKAEELEAVFSGLKKSLEPTRNWSTVLKRHCGYKGGNECTSATYHFFHLQLELRWCLVLIFGVRETIIQWVLDDLVNLAWFHYSTEGNVPLDEKQPFNCCCVKEIWVMLQLLINNQPMQKTFWTIYSEAMQRFTKSDVFFPIWLTSYLAHTSNFTVAGVYSPGEEKKDSLANGNNGYKFLQGAFKEWASKGGKSVEILKLSFELFKTWGGDCEIIASLWNQWVPRLNNGTDASNFQSYSTVDSWLTLVYKICESEDDSSQKSSRSVLDESYLGSNRDTFFHFLRLIGLFVNSCSDKDFRRLKSNLCMKLSSTGNTNDFGELGIVRVSSLFLVLAYAVRSGREAVSLWDRLQDVFSYGKVRNTPARRKSVLRAYSTMLLLILQKKLDIRSSSAAYMKLVDELLCDSSSSPSPGEPSKKELVMIYIDMLDNLPKYTPSLSADENLGRPALISTNFLMWLSKCGSNYVVRTGQTLSNITDWIVSWLKSQTDFMNCVSATSLAKSPSEAKDFLHRIKEKCLPYIQSCVVQNVNRIPATDMKPIAKLAGDITLLTIKLMQSSSKATEELFDLFANCERTSPVVSQYYVERLFKHKDLIDNSFSVVKWSQVWIRLIALDCPVPEDLTELILGSSFASTSNLELLREFCRKEWSKEDLQQMLGQLIELLKGVMNGTYIKEQEQSESERVISSVITTCATLLKNIRFDLLYIKGLTSSVGHNFLTFLCPPSWPGTPPWEKWSSPVLKAIEVNLFDIFHAVVNHAGYIQDSFLNRKVQNIVTLSFFGFIRDPNDVDKDEHPMFRILNFSEDAGLTQVQNEILPNIIAGDDVIKNAKFSQLLIRAVHLLRLKKFPTLVLRVETGVIRTYLRYPKMERASLNNCLSAIVYCCIFGSTGTFYKQLALDAFENAMSKEFAFQGTRCINLCIVISKANSADRSKNRTARMFLRDELLPVILKYVETTEQKRGIGLDGSLRTPLEALQASLATLEDEENS